MRGLLRFLISGALGFALLCLSVAAVRALLRIPVQLQPMGVLVPLLAGFAGGLGFFIFISRLPFLYVFSHELTHWLAAKAFRRRTGRFRVGGTSGSVAVEQPNVWIVLAPYFVPLYSIVWTGLYGFCRMVLREPGPWLTVLFACGLGITYAFHVRLTAHALCRSQTDLRIYGPFFSLSLITFCNLALLLLCVVVATGQWGRGAGIFLAEIRHVCGRLWWAAGWLADALGRLSATVNAGAMFAG